MNIFSQSFTGKGDFHYWKIFFFFFTNKRLNSVGFMVAPNRYVLVRRFRNNCDCYLQPSPRFLRTLYGLQTKGIKCKNFVSKWYFLCSLCFGSFCLFYSFIKSKSEAGILLSRKEMSSQMKCLTKIFTWSEGRDRTRPMCAWQVCSTGRRAWDEDYKELCLKPCPVIYWISRQGI